MTKLSDNVGKIRSESLVTSCGKRVFAPYMEARHYDLETVMSILREVRMEKYFVGSFEGGYRTVGKFLFVHDV